MPQFAPMFSVLVFIYLWCVFIYIFCVMWWASKRSYSF
uniref:ATP synthase F0 subunit 8 n=1 Tax=Dosinia troscheli TaxID=870214 RepID=A0A2S1U272_9BIVA|nr:ATP synthase F0 subunit 8 [Dosinia troscheli]AWI68004.1 ATP synthase F0 subunit 8 [Dosinia troscheli]